MTTAFIPNVVDISHYDNVTDWDAVKAFGILGVVNKATEGPGMVDRTFVLRRNSVTSRGMLYGAYHFLRPGNVSAQVDHFLATVNPTEGLALALDHEDPKVPLANAAAFCKQIHDRVGRYPWLYSGFLIKQQLGDRADPFWAQIPLWLSHYSSNPTWPACWTKPFMIQFTGDGVGPGPHNVPGIRIDGDGIDINSFSGTPDQLAAVWAAPVNDASSSANQPAIVEAHPSFGRQVGITATCFGGVGDANASAYGGMVDPDSFGVALPFRFHGARPTVTVFRFSNHVVCDVVDVGPHHTDDPYWLGGKRPRAEAESGNKAGIDMTPAVFKALGIGPDDPDFGRTTVDWQFT